MNESENTDRWFAVKLPVKFLERKGDGSIVERVKFDYAFSLSSLLDLGEWKVRKQTASDTRGFVLVKGPGISERKSILVDRVAGSSLVCIKDAIVNDVSEVSSSCAGTSEYLLTCNGTANAEGHKCVISGNYFNVSGLKHSAVVEQ